MLANVNHQDPNKITPHLISEIFILSQNGTESILHEMYIPHEPEIKAGGFKRNGNRGSASVKIFCLFS